MSDPCKDSTGMKWYAAILTNGKYAIGLMRLCPVHGDTAIPVLVFDDLDNLANLYSAISNFLNAEGLVEVGDGELPAGSKLEDYLREVTGMPGDAAPETSEMPDTFEVPGAEDLDGIPGTSGTA